jgi:hypothetical protein
MISPKKVTIIVPIYKLETNRLNNLKFILPYLINTKCRVLVVEQSSKKSSHLTKEIQKFGATHLIYRSDSKKFHKTGIINWAVKNHVDTKYAWVNDADFYTLFSAVLKSTKAAPFIKPYSVGKKLSEKESRTLLSGKELEVLYDGAGEYISLYGALSFIFCKKDFLKAGGMDESIYGWGKEDIELNDRLSALGCKIHEVNDPGIHLWHPVAPRFLPDDLFPVSSKDKDLAVITCHFNWCKFATPVNNLKRFINQTNIDGIPLYGIELSLTEEFETMGMENWIHLKVDKENICFQKEAALNILEKRVPKSFTKLAWVDHDLMFSNKNWYNDTSRLLDTYKVLQLFETYYSTSRKGTIIKEIPSIMFAGGPGAESKNNGMHAGQPGGAWAARREMWRHGGLYSLPIMGGGDAAFIYTIYNKLEDPKVLQSMGLKDGVDFGPFKAWREKIVPYVNESVSFTPGSVVHEWHGDMNNRSYGERYKLMERIDFNKCVKLGKNGLVKIINVDDKFYADMLKYFKNRKEDGDDSAKAKKQVMKEVMKYVKNKQDEINRL